MKSHMRFRILFAILLICAVCTVSAFAEFDNASTVASLRDVCDAGFGLGFAESRAITESAENRGVIGRHFDTLVMTDVLSPSELFKQNAEADYSAADEVYEAAVRDGFDIVGGALITPDFKFAADTTREEAIEQIRSHISEVIVRYPGINKWIVVEGALQNQLSDASSWRTALERNSLLSVIGDDYISIAFNAAREAAPVAELYYADAAVHNPMHHRVAYNMLSEFKSMGVTINGLYIRDRFSIIADIENIELTANHFAGLGIKVSICISDDIVCEVFDDEIFRAYRLAELFEVINRRSAIFGFVAFDGFYPLFAQDNDMQALDAYYAVAYPERFIADNARLGNPKALNKLVVAEFGIPNIFQSKADPVWDNAGIIKVNSPVYGNGGATAEARFMWNRGVLLVYAHVFDSTPDPEDSVTVFINESTGNMSLEYCAGYTVRYIGEQGFSLNAKRAAFPESKTIVDDGYIVQMQLPLNFRVSHNSELGFDIRIKDVSAGEIVSVVQYNDLSGTLPDPVNWGKLILQDNEGSIADIARSGEYTQSVQTQSRGTRIVTIAAMIILVSLMCTFIYLSKKQKDVKYTKTEES